MTSDEIKAIADELDCRPQTSAITFARIVAERCAHLASEAQAHGEDAARAIHHAFRLDEH